MTYQVLDDDGKPLDAHFDLDGDSVVFHSRGGSKQQGAVNTDYGVALRLLIRRLADSALMVTDAWVDSSRVQAIPQEERRIVDIGSIPEDPDELFSMLAERMRLVGRDPNAKSQGGNTTKRIRLQFSGATASQLEAAVRSQKVPKDFRSLERLPADMLDKVRADHIYKAVQSLLAGGADHAYGPSTDYDLVLDDGTKLPPKAVFGLAATMALGFQVVPRHFTGGLGSSCFRILERSGYTIESKAERRPTEPNAETPERPPISSEDKEWLEGKVKRVVHLRKERKSGVSQAKKDAFRAEHGRLFCERCGMDPIAVYGSEAGEACIEVHHTNLVSEMEDGAATRLDDLKCLCASCHRVEHRELRLAEQGGGGE